MTDGTALIKPGIRSGAAEVPSSKSVLHRLFIAAALSGFRDGESFKSSRRIYFRGISDDILATVGCLNALGAGVVFGRDGSYADVRPLCAVPGEERTMLQCRESGSTLRFLLPLASALGKSAEFAMEGRLSERPVEPLAEQLAGHGVNVVKRWKSICVSGALTPGVYTLPGNVSSQFVTGLLLSLPLLRSSSTLKILGPIQSSGYIDITEDVLRLSGIRFSRIGGVYEVPGLQTYRLPEETEAEGDWSGASFFLCLGAMSGKGVTVTGLNPRSSQGDRALISILESMGATVSWNGSSVTVRGGTLRGTEIDASDIPDIIPSLAALAASAEGTTVVKNAERLRTKESDRLETTFRLLEGLGAETTQTSGGLVIRGVKKLAGGTVSSYGDHRIAMAAAVAAAKCGGPVILEGAGCVKKSFPDFWEQFGSLEVEL